MVKCNFSKATSTITETTIHRCLIALLCFFAKFIRKRLCRNLFLKNLHAFKKDILAHIFFREFYNIFLSTVLEEHLGASATGIKMLKTYTT